MHVWPRNFYWNSQLIAEWGIISFSHHLCIPSNRGVSALLPTKENNKIWEDNFVIKPWFINHSEINGPTSVPVM